MEAYSFFQESILPILPENMQKMARSYVEEASDRSLEVAQANLLKVWPLIMVDGSTYSQCLLLAPTKKKNAPRTMIKYQMWVSPDW